LTASLMKMKSRRTKPCSRSSSRMFQSHHSEKWKRHYWGVRNRNFWRNMQAKA